MAKVGRFATDPKAGAYCNVTLDNGDKLLVDHDKGGFKGGLLTISLVKLWGLSSETLCRCDLDSPQGQAALARLTSAAPQGSAAATPLGAFVDYVKQCPSAADVKEKCAALGVTA